jgi:beta-1,4-mannosyl-glycoprotein beta-1,4-N-acetylglucosaminyltransferase
MKIYDCFIFFNELDLLELRLNVLNESVDFFVIVESAITFQGEDKEFYFQNNRERFAKFESKIIHFKVDKYDFDFTNLPYIKNPKNNDEIVLNKIYDFIDNCPHFDKKTQFWWGNDFYQRECIWRALAEAGPSKDDLILLSDVDEIPNPETINIYKDQVTDGSLFCFKQHEFCYYLNYFHNSNWLGTCLFLYGSYADVSLNVIRFSSKREEGLSPKIVHNGGWHFTSIGSIDGIKIKIQSWSHKEFNTAPILNSVEYNVRHGYDIFKRPGFGKLISIPIERNILPEFLVNNTLMFGKLIGPEIEKETAFQWLYHTAFPKLKAKVGSILRSVRSLF